RLIDGVRGLATLADRPDHEALPAAYVARHEHLGARFDAVVPVIGVEALEASARHNLEAKLRDRTVFDGTREAHCQQYEVGRHLALAPAHGFQAGIHACVEELFHLAIAPAEPRGGHRVFDRCPLGLARGDAQPDGPVGPAQRLVLLSWG